MKYSTLNSYSITQLEKKAISLTIQSDPEGYEDQEVDFGGYTKIQLITQIAFLEELVNEKPVENLPIEIQEAVKKLFIEGEAEMGTEPEPTVSETEEITIKEEPEPTPFLTPIQKIAFQTFSSQKLFRRATRKALKLSGITTYEVKGGTYSFNGFTLSRNRETGKVELT